MARGNASALAACERGDLTEAHSCTAHLLATIDTLLSRYETALSGHGIALPYVRIAGGPGMAGGSGGTGGEGGAGHGGGAGRTGGTAGMREATGP